MDNGRIPDSLRFVVVGRPIPQGSMHALQTKHMKYPVLTSNQPDLKPWRKLVGDMARIEMRKNSFVPIGKSVPVRLILDFYFEKETSVKRLDKITKPDLDKLVRSCGDALTGIVFQDDAQVTELIARKMYGSPARVEIEVQESDFPATSLLKSEPIRNEELPFQCEVS
jgi:Holliday junction resolvase RusA-like endonuclease